MTGDETDPILEKAKQLRAAGVPLPEIEKYLVGKGYSHSGTPFVNAQPETESAGDRYVAGPLSAAYQGLTMGAGDKITAGVRTVLPQMAGGVKGFDYPTALNEQRETLDSYRANHPMEAGGMEMAGSLPTVIGSGGMGQARAALQASRAARLAKMAGQGAAYGATASGLNAIRPGATAADVGSAAALGGGTGAVAGPVIGAVGGAVARGVSPLVGRALGREVSQEAMNEKSLRMIGGALRKGGVDPATATVPTNAPTSVMELGSRNVPSMVRAARNVPASNAAQVTDRFLNERAVGAGPRIDNALADAAGHSPTDIEQPIEHLIEQRRLEARPLYQQAYNHGEIQNPETVAQISALKQHPDFKAAWERGQRIDALENGTPPGDSRIPPEQLAALRAQGLDKFLPTSLTNERGPTVAQVDAWKKGLDAMIESRHGSANALSRSEARLYRQKLNEILSKVDQEVPDYAAARSSFKGNSELVDAAEAGASHFKPSVSATYLQRTLPDMSPGELAAYRANALNAASQKIKSLSANPDLPEATRKVNIVQRAFGGSEEGHKLQMLFPDQAAYDQFIRHAEQEALYPQTRQFMQGQSSTAAQLAEGQTSPSMWLNGAHAIMGGPMAKARLAAQLAASRMRRGMAPELADAVGQNATRTGSDLQAMLQTIAQQDAQRLGARQRVNSLLGNTWASSPDLLKQIQAMLGAHPSPP